MNKKRFRGIIHVHSNYSYDGKHSLREIAEKARAHSLDFVCMSEHSDTLNTRTVLSYVQECDSLSTPNFLMIPGIEFTCENNLHLLGIGLRSYMASMDPVFLNDFIRRSGGMSIIAHPCRKRYTIPQALLDSVDGIEIWNCVYDGRFVPNPKALQLFTETRERNSMVIASMGVDLHRLANWHFAVVRVMADGLSEGRILAALRAGQFINASTWYSISGKPSYGLTAKYYLWCYHVIYETFKHVRRRTRKTRPL